MPTKRKVKEIRANRFVLEDAEGREKACFDATVDDLVFLNIHGSAPSRAGLSVCIDASGNPTVNFQNRDGHIVMGIGLSDDLGQGLTISDSAGRPVCFIAVGPDGLPSIKLFQIVSPDQGKLLWKTPHPKRKKKTA